MIELIFLIVLISSLAGIGLLFRQKMPLFLEQPEDFSFEYNYKNFFKKIKKSFSFKSFSSEVFLQKILSKIRVLTLKTDSKTSTWLQELREKAKKKNSENNDNYWQEVKKFRKKN